MTLDEFVSKAFEEHATQTEDVYARLHEGVALVTEAKDLPSLAHLMAHVSGEHLGRWAEGVALLESLERLPVYDASTPQGKAVLRQKASLLRCAGDIEASERCLAAAATGDGAATPADRIRMLAISTTAFAFQRRIDDARRDFEEAVALGAYGPTKEDPASRALAVMGNNVSVEFENRTTPLSDDERALMLRGAEIGLQFWKLAGGPTEHGLAEYRSAMSHIKAGDAAGALPHAEEYLRIANENGADPGDVFFAHEAVARSKFLAGDVAAARAERETMSALLPTMPDESFRTYAAGELAKLDKDMPRERKRRREPHLTLKSPWK